MIFLFTLLVILAICPILPDWLRLRKDRLQTAWLLAALPAFGIGLWLLITAAGIGAQSLSNLIEIFIVSAAAVLVAYVKFFAFDRFSALQARGTLVAFVLVAVITVGLRLLMPVLPE